MNNTAHQSVVRSQKFDSQNLTIGSLQSAPVRFVIPPYQRPYAWSSEQVSQLMEDLLDFFLQPGNRSCYSLGTIVCDEETPGFFSILDGQQRLTTIDLLLEDIGHRLDRPTEEKPRRIISAYRYLAGMETGETSPLPACAAQRDCISRALNECIDRQQWREEENSKNFLVAFESCIRERVQVRRVVIPLSSEVKNEAPAMFEIINMRGQKLSALDILKSRLLSRFGGKDRSGRALFAYLWRTTEETLPYPESAAGGCELNGWKAEQAGASGVEDEDGLWSAGTTIDEIISSCAQPTTESNAQDSTQNEDDEREAFVAPIDMMNMLVIANELFKNEKTKSKATDDSSDSSFQALAIKDFGKRFDPIVRAKETGPADVWRLMGALSIVLQTVGSWGRYRKRGSDEYVSEPDAFNQLIQSFMAANGFSLAGQYWLLVLSATALENCLGLDGRLPENPEAYLGMKKPAFAKIRRLAELRLLTWAYRVAELGQKDATAAVFALIRETPSEEAARLKLTEAQNAVRNGALAWSYSNGGVSQFDLFLTDYVLWADCHASPAGRFATLKRAMADYAANAKTLEEKEIVAAIGNFDWTVFEAKAPTLRIVGRSDIEHWLARNRANLGNDAEGTEKELHYRNGFGNLALINENDNSSLGNGAPAGKAEIVLQRMSNPTPKLLWLAILSQKFPGLTGRHVQGLTRLWSDYIGTYPFV
ncbi:MAG TPA: DUF262 domain-containing HNH endonuclease family protein [Candidatus Sutterella merdavium]|nr:DUF262 domain-containing HNH endonuclease family protein [Candidatus Sutterella merdavium]